MKKVKIGFSGLTVPQQIERARLVVTSMTGNAAFPTPIPALADVTLAINALETAYNQSRDGSKIKMATMRLRRTEMLFLINQSSAYVQVASAGDEEVILSSGFDVRGKSNPTPEIAGDVTNLQVEDGNDSGNVLVTWDKASYAVLYMVIAHPESDLSGEGIRGITTKTRKELTGLTPGVRYRIVVRGLGRELPGPVSEPFFILAR